MSKRLVRGLLTRWALLIQSLMILGFASLRGELSLTRSVIVDGVDSLIPLALFAAVSIFCLIETLDVHARRYEKYPRVAGALWVLWCALMLGQAFVAAAMAPAVYPLWVGYSAMAGVGMIMTYTMVKQWS